MPHGWDLSEDDNKHAGFGYCFSAKCGAKVLVQEWNLQAAARLLGYSVGHAVKTSVPRFTISAYQIKEATAWQCRELEALNKIYQRAAEHLRKPRPYEYLVGRGIGDQDALELLEALGVAYIPPTWEWNSSPPAELQKWCDRIIFPSICPDGEHGYAGRTLQEWCPGMDENQHKIALTNYNRDMERFLGKEGAKYQVHRWRKTYRNGIFNAAIMTEHTHLYICEGAFDAIALLLAGLPNVVAVIGTQIDIQAIPKNVFDVTLAFDADVQMTGKIGKMMDVLSSIGITANLCSPPTDGRGKDWSERYRLYGKDGLPISAEPGNSQIVNDLVQVEQLKLWEFATE
jgi:hypothetical protein